MQQGTLAGSRGSHDRNPIAFANAEVNGVKYADIQFALREALAQISA
jgi:hypothetical protein